MKKIFYFALLVAGLVSTQAFAYKILKVKGSIAYFSRKGISASKGKRLKVYNDGYEIGVIKVLKLKRKYGIARIVEGSVVKGDRLRKKRSSKKKRGIKRRRSPSANFNFMTLYAGLGYYLMGDLENDQQSLLEFSNHAVLSLGADLNFSKDIVLSAYFNYGMSGDATAINLAGSPVFDTSLWELNIDGAYYITNMFYAKLGVGYTSFSYTGAVTQSSTPSENGSYDDSYTGFNLGLGGGMRMDFGKDFVLKLDVTHRSVAYSNADLNNPQTKESGDPGFSQSHIDLLFLVGYKF